MSILHPPVSKEDHVQGNKNAKITLLEYGDYQCPFCGHAYPIVKKLQKIFGNDLQFVFRNFPIVEAHPNAYNAALSAEASGLQGKFWEMHDIIFENQNSLGWDSLISYARSLGIDTNKFKKDIESGHLQQRIDGDLESGLRSGVNGTPSFFINGKKYNGDWEYKTFQQVLSDMIHS
ncbi:MAG: disulfide bond formation protein DsbA [Bacteroidetes bacterium]|nr:MAG: disulfide bond formation protein DsbA [Bacteroidota bacterium]